MVNRILELALILTALAAVNALPDMGGCDREHLVRETPVTAALRGIDRQMK